MIEEIKMAVNAGEWQRARRLLAQQNDEIKKQPEYWILNAEVYTAEGLYDHAYICIAIGISKDPSNYELYYMLGNYYSGTNVNQAYLCYQQAMHYCDNREDGVYIQNEMEQLVADGHITVKPVSFIVVSHDQKDILQSCIESIQNNSPQDSYEIIVQENAKNFVCAVNQGIKSSREDHDIFLLHDAVIVPANALFWMRMALYERESVGAAGSMMNLSGNFQTLVLNTDSRTDYLEYAKQLHIPSPNPYENKFWLMSPALLIKREAIDETGLLDECYLEGAYSDTDYGIRMTRKGYEQLLCHNAFVYCHNIINEQFASFAYQQNSAMNREYFIKKWNFNPDYYSNVRNELIPYIDADEHTEIHVLEVGCGCGATLSRIRYQYPNAKIYGIELVKEVAMCGTYMADIMVGDIESMPLPYENGYFDYIIFGDVLEHLRDPEQTLKKLKKYMKQGAKVIASIPNLMHTSVILPLLKGDFTYRDEGLLDHTHIHFFTKNEIVGMFRRIGLDILQMDARMNMVIDDRDEQEMFEAVLGIPGVAGREQFQAYQYLVLAENGEKGIL